MCPGELPVDFCWAIWPWEPARPGVDDDALYYAGLAFLAFAKFIIAMVAKSSSAQITFPSATIRSTSFASMSKGGLVSPEWRMLSADAWLAKPEQGIMGYYIDHDDIGPELPSDAISSNPMVVSLKRDGADGFVGDNGTDGVSPFRIMDGHLNNHTVVLKKKYPGWTWVYGGVVTPWGLVGYWLPRDDDMPCGEFYLWLTDRD